MAIAAVKLEEDSAPFDIPQVPLTFEELEDFERNVLKFTEPQRFEVRSRISNVLLGRNQPPTLTDAIMAERIYQNKLMRNYEYMLSWEESQTPLVRFLKIDIKEAGEQIPSYCAFGFVQLMVDQKGGKRVIELTRNLSREVVVDFHGYRVFDDCTGWSHDTLGWSYVKSLARDVRSWAGDKMGDYYDAFVAYVGQMVDRKKDGGFIVSLNPEADGGMRLDIQVHRGGVPLAGFTTIAEFNEVLYKEQHQHAG